MTFRRGAVWTADDKLCLIRQLSEVNCHALLFNAATIQIRNTGELLKLQNTGLIRSAFSVPCYETEGVT